jgi:lysyl-tRNA synthetase class 1
MEEKKYEFWLDYWARQVSERENKLKRGLKIFRSESGLGLSGLPHIGSFGDVVRQYGVTLALKDAGFKSELIAFADDRDGLRKVPLGFPNWLEEHIGKPVFLIPDPYKCHESFSQHMASLFIEALETANIEFTFTSGNETYKKGILNEQIEKLILNSAIVNQIIKKMLGQEHIKEIPYFPVCEKCGRVYTTRVYDILPKEHKVLYVCDQDFIGANRNTDKEVIVHGCTHKGEMNYFKDYGKLAWKGEFAARWAALKIVFEAHGKDIFDSVRVNDEICRRVLGWEPPLHFVYEMFLEKGGKKISKSVGNVLSPQVWFRYAPPSSLILLMLRRSEGTREINVMDIPNYSDDVDKLEDLYFGIKEEFNQRDLFNAKRLFEFIHLLKSPKKVGLHVHYSKMIEIAKILPEKNQVEFAVNKLKDFGYEVGTKDVKEIEERLEFAKNWNEDFLKPEVEKVELTERQRETIDRLIKAIEEEKDGEKLQTKIFQLAKEVGINEFFPLVYQILLKSNKGPRLGPYIIERGKEEVIKKLKEAV